MMDIVERLRWPGSRTSWYAADEQCADAADEINRLRAEVEALRADADYMRRLLAAAKCPTCDNSGTTPHGDECEWCYYRNLAAIDAARKA